MDGSQIVEDQPDRRVDKTIVFTMSELWLIVVAFVQGGGLLCCAGVAWNAHPTVLLIGAAISYGWGAVTIFIVWREMKYEGQS